MGDDIEWVVMVINEYSTATRAASGESDDVPVDVGGRPAEIADVSTAELTDAADRWFEVFRAAPDPAAVCAVLNELLGAPPPALVAVIDGSDVRAHLDVANAGTGADRLVVLGAIVLLGAVVDVGANRIGICSAGQCADVYVDRSPRQNRRYCSQLCQTRERVQRHRRRTRT